MTCGEFEQWLDAGRPKHELSRMNTHAADCFSCNRELEAEWEVERMLAVVVPASASADFSDRVMRKITQRRALEWFSNVIAEPLVPVSFALAVVIAWQNRLLWAFMNGVSHRVVHAIDITSPPAAELLQVPGVSIVFALALAPLLLLLFRGFSGTAAR